MPGLLRGMARTAVIAGSASAVNGRVARRQAERFADRDAQIYAQRAQAYQQAAPAPQAAPAAAPTAGSSTDDMISQLTRLGELRDRGVLTDEEFAAQKARILGS